MSDQVTTTVILGTQRKRAMMLAVAERSCDAWTLPVVATSLVMHLTAMREMPGDVRGIIRTVPASHPFDILQFHDL
jgi:hypothetical protein